MDWKDGRRSNNVEDLRNSSPLAAGAGAGALLIRLIPYLIGTKIGRIILLVGGLGYLGARFLGIDVTQFTGGKQAPANAQPISAQDKELVDFVSVVLGYTEDTWRGRFQSMGKTYEEPVLRLFRNSVTSACGLAQSAMGPFYCPGDHKVYIDLSFYQDLKHKLGAPGDFAQAYVIAHEVGHHVQNLLGISDKVHQAERNKSEAEANQLSVKLELQADCFAGIWAHDAKQLAPQLIESGDIEEALTAAAAVGDDHLQQQATGQIRPEKFTHGTSKQRAEWFNRGFTTGSLNDCNTFK